MTDQPDPGAIARRVIDANRFMTIATADETGLPWASPVWYAPTEYREFFWVSDPQARHSRNIANRPQVGIVIFDSHLPGGWRSVYMSAVAGALDGAELGPGIGIYTARSRAQGLREWTRDDVRPPARHRLYRATASELFALSPRDQRIPVLQL